MAKSTQKIEAIKLRKQGYSLFEIAQKLSISKSSVSVWSRDINLSQKAQDRILKKIKKGSYIGRIKGSQTNKNKKILVQKRVYDQVSKEISNVTNRELLFLGLALFWGEGNKKGSRFVFSNSDPTMIKIVLKWLIRCMNVSKEDVYMSIQINESHRNQEKRLCSIGRTN
jgi:predicted transcriptional regulator